MPSMNPATAPSTGLDRWRYVRTRGSALFTAWRTRRRWTPNFRATPLIVPIPNSSSRRNCSNSSTFVLLSTPPLPLVQRKDGTPREKGGPNSVSKVGRHPIANSVDLIRRRYDAIVAEGLAFHEAQPSLAPAMAKGGKRRRGRPPRRTGHNLLLRLETRKGDVLRFLTDPAVPFTNNEAERDGRMMKVRQKISGGFRSEQGARDFAVIRSLIATPKSRAGTSSKP